jgi:hypothetical protein
VDVNKQSNVRNEGIQMTVTTKNLIPASHLFLDPIFPAQEKCKCGAVVDLAVGSFTMRRVGRANGVKTVVITGCSMCPRDAK